MEVSASAALPKAQPKRARSTTPVAKPAEPVAVAKKAAAPRKPRKPAVVPPSPDEILGMISMAAYYRAAERGFAPGHELEDWLAAEKQVLAAM